MKATEATLLIYGFILMIGQAQAAEVMLIPSNQIIIPGADFDLNVYIDPKGAAIAGAQLDVAFNQSVMRVNNITEGGLFKQSGANSYFNSGIINNSTGTLNNIFNTIIGRKNVTTQEILIIINATAIGTSGTSEIYLSNVRISDPIGNSVGLNVTNGSITLNNPPLLTFIGNKTVNEGKMLTFNISATDPDGDSFIYSAMGLPAGGSFNPATQVFQWTPDYNQSGNYSMRFEVTDGIYTGVENINLIVKNINRAPRLSTTLNNLIINNITNANGGSYVQDTLSSGKLQYIDRNFIFTSVPSSYTDMQYIRTANDDKTFIGDSFLGFDINRDATIYVAHDDRIAQKPSWLSTFSDTNEDLKAEKNPFSFSIYARTFSEGRIILGGNYGNNSSSMYSVFISQNNSVFNETDIINISIMANDADNDPISYMIKIDGSLVSNSSNYTWTTDYSSSGHHVIDIVVSDGIEIVEREISISINNIYPRYDVDENGIVDISDLALIGQYFNNIVSVPYPRYDVNMDGLVDVLDITTTAQHFGENTYSGFFLD